MIDYEINSKDVKILRYLIKKKTVTEADILLHFKGLDTPIRFKNLVKHSFIIQILDYVDDRGAKHYSDKYEIFDKGVMAVADYDAENMSRLQWLFKDKALNIVVSVIVSFLTSILTYFFMPHIVDFISRMLP